MPVIGTDDYLQFQRNLIAESQAIYQRATAIENRVSQERRAAQAQELQKQNQAANMALALKRLAFDENVQKARESYNNQTIDLQRQRLTMQKQLNDENSKLQAVKLQSAELERDALKMQVDRARARGQNVVGIMQKYQALLAARKPGEDGTTDAEAINKAALDLMSSAIVDPEAAAEFSKGIGVAGLTGLLPEGLAPLSAQKLMAEVEAKRVAALPTAATPSDELAKLNWLDKRSDQFVQKHAQMSVAGFGTFAGKQEVRDAKESYFKTNWREADLVNRQINNIRAAGLLGVVDVDAILTQEAILSPSGDAVMERSRAKVADAEGVSQQAKKTTLAALEALSGIRSRVVAKAAGFDLIESMMTRRETVVRETLLKTFDQYKKHPDWANKTAEEATAALSAGDDQWDFVLNDPDIMAQINNYRATLDPNSKTWDAVSATITARLIQMGLDPKTQRYLIDMIRTTHPMWPSTFPK